MAQIYLKTKRDPIDVSHETAMEIKKLYLDDSIPLNRRVAIKDWSGFKSDIRSVWLNKDEYTKEKKSPQENTEESYLKERKEFQALSVEEKSKQINFFKLLYYGVTLEKEPPADIVEKALELQKEFFSTHKYNIVPDPAIFFPLLENKQCSKQIFDIVSRVANTDAKYSEMESKFNSKFEKHQTLI